MAQLPTKVQFSTETSSAIGRTVGKDSVHDKMVNNSRSVTLANNIKNYPDVIENTAKRSLEEAGAQTIRNTATGLGASSQTANQFANIAKYGKGATDSLIGVAAKGIDFLTGTNTASNLVNDLIPSFGPDGRPAASPKRASPNSVVHKMEMRGDPLLSFNWRVEMPPLPTIENFDQSLFNFYVEDVNLSLPFYSSESVFRNGSFIYYPKFSDAGSLNLVLFEDVNLTSTNYLQAWKRLIQDPNTGFYNRPSFYKKPIILTPYDMAGVPCGKFYVEGAWPSQIQQYSFTSARSIINVSCEFALNRIYFEPEPDRARMVAQARKNRSGSASSPQIVQADLLDIIRNPLEFAKSTLGLKSHSKLPINF